jgi:hypothetical protein
MFPYSLHLMCQYYVTYRLTCNDIVERFELGLPALILIGHVIHVLFKSNKLSFSPQW